MEAAEHKFITMIRSSKAKMNGYSLNFVKEYDSQTNSEQPADIHRLEFEVPTSRIKVVFSFKIENNHLLTVFIKNENDSFTEYDYVQKYKMKDIEDKIYAAHSNGDWALGLEYILELFNGPLNEVITGKRWEHIPFDWTDY